MLLPLRGTRAGTHDTAVNLSVRDGPQVMERMESGLESNVSVQSEPQKSRRRLVMKKPCPCVAKCLRDGVKKKNYFF